MGMSIIKALAAVLVFFTARTLTAEYKRFTEKRLAVLDGFLSLLSFIKNELSCRARPSAEWAGEFVSAALGEIGFTEEFIKTGSLQAAFLHANEGGTALGEESKKLLSSYFSSFGKSYRDEEIKEASRVHEELLRIISREKNDMQRSLRATRILAYATAAGLIILFL